MALLQESEGIIMFYAMVFIPTGFDNKSTVRALRVAPYKSAKAAANAIQKKSKQGYVKQLGNPTPVWNNLTY